MICKTVFLFGLLIAAGSCSSTSGSKGSCARSPNYCSKGHMECSGTDNGCLVCYCRH